METEDPSFLCKICQQKFFNATAHHFHEKWSHKFNDLNSSLNVQNVDQFNQLRDLKSVSDLDKLNDLNEIKCALTAYQDKQLVDQSLEESVLNANLDKQSHDLNALNKCQRSFRQIGGLAKHKGLKSHQCQICQKTFRRNGELNQHKEIVHQGLTPHQCLNCQKSFGLIGTLKKHIKVVHERHLKHTSVKFVKSVLETMETSGDTKKQYTKD